MAESAPPEHRIEIGIDRVVEILKAGVRRTAAFMGLGVNAALDPDFNKIELPNSISNLQLGPAIPPELYPEIKREFATWVQAAGFRELCESLEQYLAAIYRVGSYIRATRAGKISSSAVVGVPKNFLHRGVRVKLEMLLADFGIKPQYPAHLSSFWDARTCLTHRRGIVGAEDVEADGVLRVKWLGMDMLFIGNDGREQVIEAGGEDIHTGDGGVAAVRLTERIREFRPGQKLVLSPHDLHEICWSCLRASDQIVASLVRFAEAHGVIIHRGEGPPAPEKAGKGPAPT